MNSRFGGLLWMTKSALELSDIHEHVKSMIVPDMAALTEEHKVPYIPAAAVGAVLGKLIGTAAGSIKTSPWTGRHRFEPSWKNTGIGYTAGGAVGAGAGVAIAALINKIRGEEKRKGVRA